MLEFQTPQISAEKVEDNRGSFTIEPLDRGFGYTFGNSLRRVLLSSLQGAAIVGLRVKNVLHEFSTVPGVTEDVTDIVLNLKEVRVKLHDGGVGLSLKEKGMIDGTISTAASVIAGLAGGAFIAKRGLRRSLFVLALIMNVPHLCYVVLSQQVSPAHPLPLAFVATLVTI